MAYRLWVDVGGDLDEIRGLVGQEVGLAAEAEVAGAVAREAPAEVVHAALTTLEAVVLAW